MQKKIIIIFCSIHSRSIPGVKFFFKSHGRGEGYPPWVKPFELWPLKENMPSLDNVKCLKEDLIFSLHNTNTNIISIPCTMYIFQIKYFKTLITCRKVVITSISKNLTEVHCIYKPDFGKVLWNWLYLGMFFNFNRTFKTFFL